MKRHLISNDNRAYCGLILFGTPPADAPVCHVCELRKRQEPFRSCDGFIQVIVIVQDDVDYSLWDARKALVGKHKELFALLLQDNSDDFVVVKDFWDADKAEAVSSASSRKAGMKLLRGYRFAR